MRVEDIEQLETDLFLQALYTRYGYDFRHYTRASVRRRLRRLLARTGQRHVADLIAPILHDEKFGREVIASFSITVTEMFRDPGFFRALRRHVAPYLHTYPFFRAWHAGCATGEEVYALAIVLQEEELYEQATIFATDFNEAALNQAQEGIYRLREMRRHTANYQKAGGTRSFADYYHARYDLAIMNPALKENLTFAHHNLVTDGVFSEVHLILCRNVLIYFDSELQDRVLQLLADSLVHGGFLCLGTKESLRFSAVQEQFRVVDADHKIYQKRVLGGGGR